MTTSEDLLEGVRNFVERYCQWDNRDKDEKATLILGMLTEKILLNERAGMNMGQLWAEFGDLCLAAQAFAKDNPHGWKDVCLYAYGDGAGIKDALYEFVNWLSTEKASSVCCAVGDELLSFKPLGIAESESLADEFLFG